MGTLKVSPLDGLLALVVAPLPVPTGPASAPKRVRDGQRCSLKNLNTFKEVSLLDLTHPSLPEVLPTLSLVPLLTPMEELTPKWPTKTSPRTPMKSLAVLLN